MENFLAAFPAVAAFLLVGAGLAKAVRPTSAVDGLNALGLSLRAWHVRLGAFLEATIGVLGLISGSDLVRISLVASYLAFAIYVNIARRSPAVKSCGCFGETGSPPTVRQVVIDLLIAFGVVASIVVASPTPVTLVAANAVTGIAFALLCACSAWLITFVLDTPVRSAP